MIDKANDYFSILYHYLVNFLEIHSKPVYI